VVDYLQEAMREGPESKPTPTLERALADFQARAGSDPEVNRQITAMRFYLRDLLWACTTYVVEAPSGPMTNYTTLARRLCQWSSDSDFDLCMVSFNYDLLLESACAAMWGLDPMDLASYTSHERYSMVKPHGSVQWEWALPSEDRTFESDARRTALAVRAGPTDDDVDATNVLVRRTPPHISEGVRSSQTPITVPAIALPIVEKAQFAWPRSQADHFAGLLGRVSRVLTIGWRAAEPHFLGLLADALVESPRVDVVVGGLPPRLASAEAADVLDRLRTAGVPTDRSRQLLDGFDELVFGDGLDRVLERWSIGD
jgi:hypothetical protein